MRPRAVARPWLLPALLGLTACGEDFRPETLVEHLRVLSVRATPPEVRPGEAARIEALVLDPSRPGQASTVVWIGCDPDPFNQNRGACSDMEVLKDPSQLTIDPSQLPPGVRLIGLGPRALYPVPRTLFDVLPEGDERRVLGTVGQILALAVAEEISPLAPPEELQALLERVKAREVRSLITLFRVKVSENPERNANPELSRLIVAKEPLPEGARAQVLPGERVQLDVEVPETSSEVFTSSTPAGGTEQQQERLLAAWYSTAGRFTEERTTIGEGVKTVFTAPGSTKDPVPDSRAGSFYVVLRDTRGGQVWREYPFYVCDQALPPPQITAIRTVVASPPGLVLEGQHLDSVLDVVIEGRAVAGGTVEASGTWEGTVSPSPGAGAHQVTIFTRSCGRFTAAQPWVAP